MTSGDAVEVDFAQVKAGGIVTSPILTTSGTAIRAVDIPTITGLNTARWFNALAGTFVLEIGALPTARP